MYLKNCEQKYDDLFYLMVSLFALGTLNSLANLIHEIAED
jgi:hypothetical protein